MPEPRRDNIRSFRQGLGMKRPELARRVGISYKHMWGIEEGNHTAAVETLQLIADQLGVDIKHVVVPAAADPEPQPQPVEPERKPNPTSHPQPTGPAPPPPPRRKNSATADGDRISA